LKNGDLGYGVSSSLLIIDKKTLELKQMITNFYQYNLILNFHVLIDEATKESRILVQIGYSSPD
jgi:hypothetical protein